MLLATFMSYVTRNFVCGDHYFGHFERKVQVFHIFFSIAVYCIYSVLHIVFRFQYNMNADAMMNSILENTCKNELTQIFTSIEEHVSTVVFPQSIDNFYLFSHFLNLLHQLKKNSREKSKVWQNGIKNFYSIPMTLIVWRKGNYIVHLSSKLYVTGVKFYVPIQKH